MLETEVYAKTEAGRDEIKSRKQGLSMSVRAILLMVDGQRTVSAMRALIAGSKAPPDVLELLIRQRLIEPRAAQLASQAVAPAVVSAPIVAGGPVTARTPPPIAAPAQSPLPTAAPANATAGRPAVAPAPFLYDGPLDLMLPTIFAEDPVESASAPPHGRAIDLPAEPAVAVAVEGPVPLDRYEKLYTMMNEVVRDFLAPHRRYFIQLKIERCGTPDELLELLHGLQIALAKARGEAFAFDVIARLRNAAT